MNTNHATVAQRVVDSLAKAIGPSQQPLTLLHGPDFRGNEWAYVKECIDTAWVSSAGKYVDRFEEALARYTGAQHAIALSNGTSALFVALHMAGVERDDEVLVPALSFVATANAVVHCGAVPHFVDSEADTLGMDPAMLSQYLHEVSDMRDGRLINRQTGRRIAAIVPMHTFGFPVSIAPLVDIADQYGVPLIEDAAESLGTWVGDRHTGTFGRLGVLSFNGNKTITTGGGGAILTNDEALARATRHITTTGKVPHKWAFFHDVVAWNFRLPNLNAALGFAQMERLPEILASKRALADRYDRAFAGDNDLSFIREPAGCHSNYWLNAIRLNKPNAALRDAILEATNAAGYQCRPVWTLLSSLPMFKTCPRSPLPIATSLESTVINVPSSSYL